MKTFISYSHRDQAILERLHTHLAMLRRGGLLSDWFDRDILAGQDIDKEIAGHLSASGLFLAIVSPDFLHSNYCYEKEMTIALARHRDGDLLVVPIIAEPCEWTESPLGQLKALPKDGKPISEWVNQNTALLDVAKELRRLLTSTKDLSEQSSPDSNARPSSARVSKKVSTRYRIPREFDEIDRSDFVEEAFQTIRKHFESSIREIDSVEGLRGRFREISATAFTCTILNRMRSGSAAHITVHSSARSRESSFGFGEITYSFQENGPPNQSNGWISVEADKYQLSLKINTFQSDDQKGMTAEQVASRLWGLFLEQGDIGNE